MANIIQLNDSMVTLDIKNGFFHADFLCTIADDSHRPQTQLNTAKATLSHLYDCYDIPCPADGKDITLFTSALIKSQTQHTMKKSTVMPIHKLTSMFLKWPEDSELSIKDLRLKCIVLLSLIFMCQPSDLAPKAQLFNPADSSTSNMEISVDQVFLLDSNDFITIKFLGIKIDTGWGLRFLLTWMMPCDHTSHGLKRFATLRNDHSSYRFTMCIVICALRGRQCKTVPIPEFRVLVHPKQTWTFPLHNITIKVIKCEKYEIKAYNFFRFLVCSQYFKFSFSYTS